VLQLTSLDSASLRMVAEDLIRNER
jgi:hypothetical protein